MNPALRRAFAGFDIPKQITGEPTPEVRITTTAYDATSPDEIKALGPLTRNETRLLNQGGAEAVRLDRAFYHKENCGNVACADPKHRGMKGNEQTGQPGMVQTDGSGSGASTTGYADQPKRSEAWQQESPAPSAVHLPQLSPADVSRVGTGTQTQVEAGARAVKRGRGRPKGSRDSKPRRRK